MTVKRQNIFDVCQQLNVRNAGSNYQGEAKEANELYIRYNVEKSLVQFAN